MTADITRLDGIATLTLRTSHAMNSCSMTDFGALRDRFIELGADPEVHAVILTGSGRAFCVGAALDTFLGEAGLSGAPERLREGFDTCLNPLLRAMVDLPKPLVIAINGTVAGGGMGLALLGDLVIASDEARFHCAFVRMLGIVPDAGVSWLLPNLMGRNRALPLALLGENLSARDAVEAGLIWRAVPAADLMAEAENYAHRLSKAPPEALRMTRHLFTDALSTRFGDLIDRERDANVALCARPELEEGVRAFLEKRAPDFRAIAG